MATCDFYTMDHEGQLDWIGSHNGMCDPTSLPKDIFLQPNMLGYEDEVENYLSSTWGYCKYNGDGWQWDWDASDGTDYIYIYHECSGDVLLCVKGSRPVDVIKILKGVDMIGADVGIGQIKFPNMKKECLNGSKSSKVI